MSFSIKIWGCNGSIPTPITTSVLQRKIFEVMLLSMDKNLKTREEVNQFLDGLPFHLYGTYHGNTSCVEVLDNSQEDFVIFDAGSGIRELGMSLMDRLTPHSHIHIFMSHFHWDHIQGFPFFNPIYRTSSKITIYGCHKNIEKIFRQQQGFENFPVKFEQLPAQINFEQWVPDQSYRIGKYQIRAHRVPHPGGSYAYRVEKDGKSIVYATDLEIKDFTEEILQPYYDFFSGAEYLIYDSMYTVPENVMKENWGHSSAIIGLDLALKAKVKNMVIFHHDPTYADEAVSEILHSALLYKKMKRNGGQLKIIAAYDGLELAIPGEGG